ncbi:MAG: tripartite tricarboxylate transporter TctB family protein [Planctomycetaceae bacterium]|nr:tripartite tricarboxylate transporter TctB family protein [Planctomycetaceae bacterium]
MSHTQERSTGDWSLCLFWVGVGLFFLWFASDIPVASFTSEGDPGPRAFPRWLGAALVIGGAFELLKQQFLKSTAKSETPTEATPTLSRRNGLVVLIAVAIYIPSMTLIGFSLATLCLVTGLLRFLGSRWWISAVAAVTLVVLIQLLFAYGFNVPLPTNYWGLVLPGGFLF